MYGTGKFYFDDMREANIHSHCRRGGRLRGLRARVPYDFGAEELVGKSLLAYSFEPLGPALER